MEREGYFIVIVIQVSLRQEHLNTTAALIGNLENILTDLMLKDHALNVRCIPGIIQQEGENDNPTDHKQSS